MCCNMLIKCFAVYLSGSELTFHNSFVEIIADGVINEQRTGVSAATADT